MHNNGRSTGSGRAASGHRRAVIFGIMLIIALIHMFRVGTFFRGSLFTLYYSYFSDIVVPFGMYFLLCLAEEQVRFLRDWRVKAAVVFGFAAGTEILQACGVPLLGKTFDPLDFLMFGAGALLAACVDRCLLDRFLTQWSS
jgi:hypothetical protein